MSDDNTQQNDQSDTEQLGDAGKKALDAMKAERNAAKRDRDALQVELDKLKQAQLSDLEKATQRAEAAEKRVSEMEHTQLRQRIALAKGLPVDLVNRLHGESEDDLNADADALLALVNAPRTPKPDTSQGSKGEATTSNPADAFAAFAADL